MIVKATLANSPPDVHEPTDTLPRNLILMCRTTRAMWALPSYLEPDGVVIEGSTLVGHTHDDPVHVLNLVESIRNAMTDS